MESTLLIFFAFIVLSLFGAVLLFTYFKSRKSQAPLIKPNSITSKQLHKEQHSSSYFKQKTQRDTDPKFLLTYEEKASRLKLENLNPPDSSSFIFLELVNYIHANLNIIALKNTKSYASIPIDPFYPDSNLSRLKKHALIDADGYFSERGFDLLCILSRFMESGFLHPSVDKNDLSDSYVNPN